MKKIFFFLSLVLIMIGVGITRAFIVTPTDEYVSDDNLDGQNVIITMEISNYNGSVGNHQRGGKSRLTDTGDDVVKHPGVEYSAISQKNVWTIEFVESDEVGDWYRLKNLHSNRYMGYHYDEVNTDDLESLPGEYDDDFETGFFNEDGWLNCVIPLDLVENAEDAKLFTLKRPSEGVLLLGEAPTNENVVDLIESIDDEALMIIARCMNQGKAIYAAVNSAYASPSLARYNDWAGYWCFMGAEVADDPYTELANYLENLEVQQYAIGNDPGYVEQQEEAQAYNDFVNYLLENIDDNSNTDQWFIDNLEKMKEWVEKAKAFTYRPVVAGYYRLENLGRAGRSMCLHANNGVYADESNNEDINQVWEVTADADKLYLKHFYTQRYIVPMTNFSTLYKTSYTPEYAEFACLGSTATFNIKVGGKGGFLHAAGGFDVVGWYGGLDGNEASRWYIHAISEEEMKEAFGEDILDNAKVIAEFNKLLADAKSDMKAAKESGSKPLVTSASQISSPKTQSGEGSIAALIDDDYGTYWHSNWAEGSVGDNEELVVLHYLQFDLGQTVQNVTMKYARRSGVANDHPTKFTIWASNEADGEYAVVVEEFPVVENEDGTASSGADRVTYSYDLDFGAAYRYVRVRATMTDQWRGYWHASEMNFCTAGGVDLWAKAEPAASALEEAIAEAEAVETPTREDVDKLKAAYEAFLAVYTDPTALNAAIKEAQNELAALAGGNAPGQKPADVWNALDKAAKDAQAWLEANLATCTKAQLAEQEAKMKQALEAWYAVPTAMFNTNTWYYIESLSKGNSQANTAGTKAGTKWMGARLAAAYGSEGDLDLFGATETSKIGGVAPVHFNGTEMTEEEAEYYASYIYNDQMAQWRFIEMPGGNYAIQNRVTGTFFPVIEKGTGFIDGSVMPGSYNVRPLAGGAFDFEAVYGKDDEGNDRKTYINFYNGSGQLGLWVYGGADDYGSLWRISVAEEIAADHQQEIYVGLDSMTVRGITLPYAIDVNETNAEVMFFDDVLAIEEVALFERSVGLKQNVDAIAAGTPFVVFSSSQAEGVMVGKVKMVSDEMSWKVDNSGALKGTLVPSKINAGAAVPSMWRFEDGATKEWGSFKVINKAQATPAGTAWLDIHNVPESIFTADTNACDATVVLDTTDGDLFDAIEVVKADNGTYNVIYNLNGQRVSAAVKGMVIINGKKVILK